MPNGNQATEVAPGCEREVVDRPAAPGQRRAYRQLCNDESFRFWQKIDRSGGEDSCWPWTARRNQAGYGTFTVGVKADGQERFTAGAHRLALFIVTGVIGDVAMHACDNPPCCNPRHLKWADQPANCRDMFAKERNVSAGPVGERSSLARLTAADVLAIRAELSSSARQRSTRTDLAKRFGVSYHAIRYIELRRTWRHV